MICEALGYTNVRNGSQSTEATSIYSSYPQITIAVDCAVPSTKPCVMNFLVLPKLFNPQCGEITQNFEGGSR